MLEQKRKLRQQVMENGSHVDGPFFKRPPEVGKALKFTYKFRNINPGHNLPSGSLGAQPEIWLNVALIDPHGKNIWESGYTDSHGDMADLHSRDVRTGKIRDDHQLVNLQTKFLTTNVKGTDRRNVFAGQLRHRPASVYPPPRSANHRTEPSAVCPNGRAQCASSFHAECQLHRACFVDERARQVSACLPCPKPSGTDLLHGFCGVTQEMDHAE